jgi:hypothetical protein
MIDSKNQITAFRGNEWRPPRARSAFMTARVRQFSGLGFSRSLDWPIGLSASQNSGLGFYASTGV